VAKQIYIARSEIEAHKLRLFLAAHGIEAHIGNDDNAAESVHSPGNEFALPMFVDDADWDEANELLREFADQSGGEFPNVDQTSLESVERVVPGANRSAWSLWLEVIVVFALAKPLYDGHSLVDLVTRALGIRDTAANLYLPALIYNGFAILVAFTAIRWSGDRWSSFGITKPTWTDVVTASIAYVVAFGATMMGVDILIDILRSRCGEHYVYQLIHAPRPSYSANGWTGFAVLLLLAMSIGYSEELLARGYLIPRLERLLQSTWASVIASAGVFGVLHWHRGILSMWSAFLGGLVYGIAFAWTRRLWPVAFAHALYDFSIFLARSG